MLCQTNDAVCALYRRDCECGIHKCVRGATGLCAVQYQQGGRAAADTVQRVGFGSTWDQVTLSQHSVIQQSRNKQVVQLMRCSTLDFGEHGIK